MACGMETPCHTFIFFENACVYAVLVGFNCLSNILLPLAWKTGAESDVALPLE